MEGVAAVSDHLERLLRDHPEWAGRLMDPPLCTWLEWEFDLDRTSLAAAMQRLIAEKEGRA